MEPANLSLIQRTAAALDTTAEPQALLDQLSAVDPTDGDAHAAAQWLRGVACYRLGRTGEAIMLISDAIARGWRAPEAVIDLARVSGRNGVTTEAARILFGALAHHAESGKLGKTLIAVCDAIGFRIDSDATVRALAFDRLMVPLLKWALQRKFTDLALFLEANIYNRHVKAIENEKHFRQCMAAIAPALSDYGLQWRTGSNPVPRLGARKKVAFFIHTASMLAHIEALLNFLRGYRRLDDQPFEAIVISFDGKSPDLERELDGIGVRIVTLPEAFPETRHSAWARLLKLRDFVAAEGIGALVWTSVVTMMPLAFAMRIAPVQLWLALKYHSLATPDIDAYVTGGSLARYRTIDGRIWRTGTLGVDNWVDPSKEAEARRIRAQFGDAVVLGTLAREEKMSDPAYLDMVVRLLKKHPNAIFLWAGRTESAVIREAFVDGGVLMQTRHIGWVDTRLYAQVFDIFLDTFPYPCGFTLCQALAAGTPAVMLNTEEAVRSGIWAYFKPVVEGSEGSAEMQAELRSLLGTRQRPLVAFVDTTERYFEQASALIENATLRKEAGEAGKQLMQKYFSDPLLMGRTLRDHFVELLELAEPQELAV
jgi:hypothetical protein